MQSPQFLRLPAILELYVRKLVDGFEHHEAWFATSPFLLPQEALVKERGGAFEYVRGEISLSVAYRLHGLQGRPTREDAKPREEQLLALVEQLVTPFDSVPQRSLPLRQVCGSSGEEFEPVAEPIKQQLRGEQFN